MCPIMAKNHQLGNRDIFIKIIYPSCEPLCFVKKISIFFLTDIDTYTTLIKECTFLALDIYTSNSMKRYVLFAI